VDLFVIGSLLTPLITVEGIKMYLIGTLVKYKLKTHYNLLGRDIITF
jgi:hypothetical protein